MPIEHQQNKIQGQIYVYSINKTKIHFFLGASDLNYLQGDKGTNTNHVQILNLESAKVRKAIQLILKKFNIVQRVLRKIIRQSSLQIQREETQAAVLTFFFLKYYQHISPQKRHGFLYLHRVKSRCDETFSNLGHKFIQQTWCIAFQIGYRCHQSGPQP